MTIMSSSFLRKGIAGVINGQPDMVMVAQASTGGESITLFREHRPDVTLMDLRLPDISGIEALTAIRVGRFEIRLDSLQLAPFEYDHLFYQPRGSRGERLAVGRYLIGNQGEVLVPSLSDECKNV